MPYTPIADTTESEPTGYVSLASQNEKSPATAPSNGLNLSSALGTGGLTPANTQAQGYYSLAQQEADANESAASAIQRLGGTTLSKLGPTYSGDTGAQISPAQTIKNQETAGESIGQFPTEGGLKGVLDKVLPGVKAASEGWDSYQNFLKTAPAGSQPITYSTTDSNGNTTQHLNPDEAQKTTTLALGFGEGAGDVGDAIETIAKSQNPTQIADVIEQHFPNIPAGDVALYAPRLAQVDDAQKINDILNSADLSGQIRDANPHIDKATADGISTGALRLKQTGAPQQAINDFIDQHIQLATPADLPEGEAAPNAPTTSEEAASSYYKDVIEPQIGQGKTIQLAGDDMKTHFGNDYDPTRSDLYASANYQNVERLLKDPAINSMSFLGGGPGSGKSEFVGNDIRSKNSADLLYDTTFSNEKGIRNLLDIAEKNGKKINVSGILANKDNAWQYVQKRAGEIGRPVTRDAFNRGHDGFLKTISALLADGTLSPRQVKLFDLRNVSDPDEARKIVKLGLFTKDPIALLKKTGYNTGNVNIQPRTGSENNGSTLDTGSGRASSAIPASERGVQGRPADTGGSDRVLQTAQSRSEVEKANTNYLKQTEKEERAQPTAQETKLGQLFVERDAKEEALTAHPARELAKYATNRSGELPEAFGTGRGIFRTTGDQRVTGLGFSDSETARESYQDYRSRQKDLENLNKEISDTRKGVAEERAKTKEERITRSLLEKTAKDSDRNRALEERKAAIKKASEDADRMAKENQAYLDKLERNAKTALREGAPKEGIAKGILRTLNPVRYLRTPTKAIVENWLIKRNLASIRAREVEKQYGPHKKDGINTFIAQQDGAKIPYLTAFFDNEITDANRRGLDVPYQENYMPQAWKETPAQIKEIVAKRMEAQGLSKQEIQDYLEQREQLDQPTAARLKLNPFFTKEKAVPDYRTGISMGLTPKYDSTPALMAHYVSQKEIAIANRNLGINLKENGDLKPTDLEQPPAKWEKTEIFGRSYWAPRPLANFLNDYLRNNNDLTWQQKIAHVAATSSHLVQNIGLMAGIPGTTIQSFPISMLFTEMAGYGNIKAIKPFILANSNHATASWIEKNWDIIKKMTEDGVPVDALAKGEWNKESLADVWKNTKILDLKSDYELAQKLFNAGWQTKVYDRMIPMLSTELYKDIYNKQLKKGLPEEEARRIASETVKNKYVFRQPQGKTTAEFLRSLAYGPVWREQVGKMLWNTAKSGYDWRTWNNQSYSQNRKLLWDLLVTFTAFQIINLRNTGRFTWQNATGHELDIDFPQADGSHVYGTFFPSLMTVPKIIAGMASAGVHGDIAGVGSQFKNLLNPIIQNAYSVVTNQDYFDRPIYKPTDTAAEKIGKSLAYFGSETFEPSFVKSITDYLSGKDTGIQSLINLTNGIIKYQSNSSAANSDYFDALAKLTNQKVSTVKAFQPTYDNIRGILKSGDTQKATTLYNALSPSDKTIYDSMKKSELTQATIERERNIYPIVEKGRALMTSGKNDEAYSLYNALSPEDKKAYDSVKKRFFSSE